MVSSDVLLVLHAVVLWLASCPPIKDLQKSWNELPCR
jgi:hypothetical protein